MIRYSSNEYDTDPRYIEELIRYNEMYHHDYNPGLDTKASRLIFDKVLNVPLKQTVMEYDKRFMVKAPKSQSSS